MKVEIIKNGQTVQEYNQSVEALVPSKHDLIEIDGEQHTIVARRVSHTIDEKKRAHYKVSLYV